MNVPVIFSNIIGFDGLIFLLAGVNAFIFARARISAERLYDNMHREIYAPSAGDDMRRIKSDINRLTDRKVSRMREKAVSLYTLYVNISGLFPLMGILGTVISLLGMVGNMSDVSGNFFAALTSTFWGLIFAIIFKFLDGFISPILDDGERAAELFMQRRTELYGGLSVDVDNLFDVPPEEPERMEDKENAPEPEMEENSLTNTALNAGKGVLDKARNLLKAGRQR